MENAKKEKHGFFNMKVDMTEGPLFKNYVIYFLPFVVSSIIQTSYSAIDMMILGQFAGDTAVAAVGATSSILSLVLNLFIGIAAGYNILLLRYYGAKDKAAVKSTNSTSLIFSIAIGIVLMIFGILFVKPFLRLTNCPEEIIADATLYARIYFLALPAIMFNNYFNSLIKATGDSTSALIYNTVSGAVNIVLNLFFVLVLKWSVAGVAIATTASFYVTSICIFLKTTRAEGLGKLELTGIKFSFDIMKKLVKLGLPPALPTLISSLVSVFSSSIKNSYGTSAIAGIAAASSIFGVIACVGHPIGSVTTSFVAQNMGARRQDNVFKIRRFSIIISLSLAVLEFFVMVVFARPLLSLYVPGVEEAIVVGKTYLICLGIRVLLNALPIVCSAMLSAYGKSLIQMIISVVNIGVNFLWLLVIYGLFPTLDTYLLTTVAVGVVHFAFHIIAEHYFTKKYKQGCDFAL